MSWGAVAGISAAVGAVGGLLGAGESNELSGEQKALLVKQAGIADDLNGISQDQKGLYDQYSGDVFDELFSEIDRPVDYEGEMGKRTADVNQVFDQREESTNRQNFRYGVNPSSGKQQEAQRRNGLDRAITNVDVRNKARVDEDDEHWARLLTGANTVQGFIGNSISAGNSAMGGTSSAASGYGNLADRASQSASNGLQAAGYFANLASNSGGSGSSNTSSFNGVYDNNNFGDVDGGNF